MNLSILPFLFTTIPQLIRAVEAIMASDAAHTIESAIEALISHNTPGQPNEPSLN